MDTKRHKDHDGINGKPKDSAKYKQDQRSLAYRQAVKKWRERGFSRLMSRSVAASESRKPKPKKE